MRSTTPAATRRATSACARRWGGRAPGIVRGRCFTRRTMWRRGTKGQGPGPDHALRGAPRPFLFPEPAFVRVRGLPLLRLDRAYRERSTRVMQTRHHPIPSPKLLLIALATLGLAAGAGSPSAAAVAPAFVRADSAAADTTRSPQS